MADHREDAVYVVSLAERGSASSEASASSWLDATAASISALAASAKQACSIQNGVGHAAMANGVQHGRSALGEARHCNGAGSALDAELQPRHSKQQYLKNVQECLQAKPLHSTYLDCQFLDVPPTVGQRLAIITLCTWSLMSFPAVE